MYLARNYQAAGLSVSCFAGGDQIRFRMYPGGIRQLFDGWSKNLATGAVGTDRIAVALAVLWVCVQVATARRAPADLAAWTFGSGGFPFVTVAAWLLVVVQLRALLRRVGSFRATTAILFPIPLLAFVAMFARSLLWTFVRRSVVWRGRRIQLRVARPDVRVVFMSDFATVMVDVIAWGAVHAGTGYVVHRLPVSSLERALVVEVPRLRPQRPFLRAGASHQAVEGPRARSRRCVPGRCEQAFGAGSRAGGLERFVVETRRAELGHWLAACAGPFFVLWNPPLAAVVLIVYGLAANLPFVAIQRYNRIRAPNPASQPRNRARPVEQQP